MKETTLITNGSQAALDDIETTSGLCYYGVVTAQVAGLTTTAFQCSGLSGWGNDDFIHLYYVQVRRTTDGAAPEYEIRRISDYVSATGQFTVDTAFSAAIDVNDVVLIIHEALKETMDSPSLELDFSQSPSGTVEEGGQIHFHVGMVSKDSGPLGLGRINIGAATIVLEQQRGVGVFSNVGITQPTVAKAIGRVYSNTRMHPTEWQVGDMYKVTLSGITVLIDGETGYVPDFVWSGVVLEEADLHVKVNRIDDNVSDTKSELEDLSEAAQVKTSLEDLAFLERPQSGDEYVRVEVKFKDLDGDMADPYTNVLGISVINSASTSRTGLCYKDVAGVAQLDLVGGAGAIAAYRELERTAQGQYYFFYKVTDDADLEELIANFGWTESGLYYEDTEYSYHTVGFQIVSQLNDPNQPRDYETTEDLNQAAATYDLFTATGGDVKVTDLIIRMPDEACAGATTSISIQTNTTTAHTLISSAQGAVANLTAEAELAWEGKTILKSGEKIQLTIAGGAHGSTYTTEIHAEAEPLDAGAYLA